MRIALLLLCTFAFCTVAAAQEESNQQSGALLLTPQLLRRLERDHERQTVRWLNFEKRVNTVPDSSERGFELALYYAITHDQKRGREAVEWALAHSCNKRQVAMVLSWCADLLTEAERQKFTGTVCDIAPSDEAAQARDAFFARAARGNTAEVGEWPHLLSWLEAGHFKDSDALYAACEYLSAVRSSQQVDLRQEAPQFFSKLASEFLLALHPDQVEHPPWIAHIAALALVSLDPNLPGSQYLQGWAVEESQMIREGPGVAYEFLWADPYLPGLAYENLDPWVYDKLGRVFARTAWDRDSCWISISADAVEEQHCSAGWRQQATIFGRLTLVPMTSTCMDVPHFNQPDAIVLWHFAPNEAVTLRAGKRQIEFHADSAGLLPLEAHLEGKICRPR